MYDFYKSPSQKIKSYFRIFWKSTVNIQGFHANKFPFKFEKSYDFEEMNFLSRRYQYQSPPPKKIEPHLRIVWKSNLSNIEPTTRNETDMLLKYLI